MRTQIVEPNLIICTKIIVQMTTLSMNKVASFPRAGSYADVSPLSQVTAEPIAHLVNKRAQQRRRR